MQRVKEKAIQLLKDGVVDRVIGWKAGEFFYDLTPAVFTSAEEVEKDFVWSVFSAANVSKYLIAESKKGGRIAAFLKPCDSYSFVQLCKEHRIAKENVYVVGVQCDGTCDIEKLKALGFKGVTGVEERGEELLVSTLYGGKTAAKKDALLERCMVCKSKRIAYFDELLGEQGEDCGDARFEAVEKLEAMTCVCSVGLDMIAIPGNTKATTISGIIADEMAIGMVNQKTTAVRLIPVIGKEVGETVEFGGLLGYAPIMPVNNYSCDAFVNRRGRIPAPIHSFKN